MTDALGFRAVFSVSLPSTNAVVGTDVGALRPAGVTNQSYRFPLPGLPASVERLEELLRPTLGMVLACEPDRIVVACSPAYVNDAANAALQLRRTFEKRVAIPVTLASDAVSEAVKAFGVTRVEPVTSFLPEANCNVSSHFAAHGISVVAEAGFSSAQIGRAYTARIDVAEILDAFERVDTPEVEALVQVARLWYVLASLTTCRRVTASRL